MTLDIRETHMESECRNCGETIEPGEVKLVIDSFAGGTSFYKTYHIECVDGEGYELEVVEQ